MLHDTPRVGRAGAPQPVQVKNDFGRVSPRTGTPIVTSIVVGSGAALALVVNVGQSAIFTALASLCIAMLYLAYLGVTGPLLIARIRQASIRHAHHRRSLSAQVDETGRPLFSLGRWGIPLNLIVVAYQIVAIVNLAWPRKAVYDLTGHTWWLQWSAVLFIGLSLIVGIFVHQRMHRNAAVIPVTRFHALPAGGVPVAAPEVDLA